MRRARGGSRAMPSRIQRSRVKGWRMPENAVYVGRPTKWGNPFKVGQRNLYGTITADNRHAASIYLGFAPQNEGLIAAAQAELAGRDLACWCGLCDMHRAGKPLGSNCPYCDRCHADTLLKLANSTRREPGGELCEECGKYFRDPPSRLCPGCEAYKEHQR